VPPTGKFPGVEINRRAEAFVVLVLRITIIRLFFQVHCAHYQQWHHGSRRSEKETHGRKNTRLLLLIATINAVKILRVLMLSVKSAMQPVIGALQSMSRAWVSTGFFSWGVNMSEISFYQLETLFFWKVNREISAFKIQVAKAILPLTRNSRTLRKAPLKSQWWSIFHLTKTSSRITKAHILPKFVSNFRNTCELGGVFAAERVVELISHQLGKLQVSISLVQFVRIHCAGLTKWRWPYSQPVHWRL